jgi:hypothetical protein
MKIRFSILLVFTVTLAYPQTTEWSTELQSSFIDISGLFGLNEPAQVTTLQYRNKGFFVDGFHSFSWKEPGKTVQSFFGAGYTFWFDSLGTKTLSIKNDFAFNRVANNGSFLRPMVIGKWAVHPKHTLYFVSWIFFDTRREPKPPLNGGTAYLAHAFTVPFKGLKLRNELRLLFVRIQDIRDVSGVVNQLKLSENKNRFYIIGNLGYSFYRSDGITEWIWNVGIGKGF